MTLRTGDRAPGFDLELDRGRRATLDDYSGRRLILIFLRHLA